MSQFRRLLSLRSFDPSLLLAGICTGAYYIVISLPSMRDSVLAHYTTEHIVEYVIVALFIWGVIDIGMKLLAFPREILASRKTWMPVMEGRVPADAAAALLEQVQTRPSWLLQSRIGQRLVKALAFVKDKGAGEAYSEHLRYLAEQDHNHSHANYTLIRFVIAVAPILGFFGTVIHFGTAIGGFSLDEPGKINGLLSEMGTAFNTTAVALAAAVTMIFAMFMCERVESSLVKGIDRIIDCELANRFQASEADVSPILATIQTSHDETLNSITATLQRQIEVWSGALDTLFQKFGERQGHEAQRWQVALDELRKRHEAYDIEREKRLRQTFTVMDSRQEKQLAQVQAALDKALSFRAEIGELTQALAGIARGEGKLVELQSSLANNLRVIHETRQIDGALHGLTAAIHLLTARDRQIGIHDHKAA